MEDFVTPQPSAGKGPDPTDQQTVALSTPQTLHDREASSAEATPTRSRTPPDAALVDQAPVPTFGADRRIGRFVVLKMLGRGGMGTVYAAYDGDLDRKVAVKVLHPDQSADEEHQQRLRREAQALARLTHPHVVTVHEVGLGDGAVFVAMEFIQGQSLAAWQRTKPGWVDVLKAYVQAGHGLMAAHEAGMVHRDFKPANVMRSDEGVVKVLDFGLARAAADDFEGEDPTHDLSISGRSSVSSLGSLTLPGTVMGTPVYMAPEQLLGNAIDARSDQYSYCVALWEGLCGARPFAAADIKGLLAAKYQGPPRWPTQAPPVPRGIVEAIVRGLSPQPDDRWPSMNTLLAELRWDPQRRRRQ